MTEFSTCFFIEQAVEARKGVPGQRPEIDYTVCGEDTKGNILYAIPTEVKAHAMYVHSKMVYI